MKPRKKKNIGYFVSPHGWGHAARASAVMDAVREIDPTIRFEIFTTIPRWFFEDSLDGAVSYHPILTDIGLVQETPLRADLAATIRALDRFIPFSKSRIDPLSEELMALDCELVMCDIAPLGIAAAREVGIPSLLVENFTWDWVYQEYWEAYDNLKPHADYLAALFSEADYHIQTEPVCSQTAAHLTVLPVSRRPRQPGDAVRERLGIPEKAKLVLVTMGGVPEDDARLGEWPVPEGIYLVVPGTANAFKTGDRLIPLPHRSPFFHPDLMAAADGVVGKVGYSTLAEVYHGGAPFGYIKRPDFRESEILADYIEKHMSGFAIEEAHFRNGKWLSHIHRLLEIPRIQRIGPNGADQIAEFVSDRLR